MKDDKFRGLTLVAIWLTLLLVSWIIVATLAFWAVFVFKALVEVLSA